MRESRHLLKHDSAWSGASRRRGGLQSFWRTSSTSDVASLRPGSAAKNSPRSGAARQTPDRQPMPAILVEGDANPLRDDRENLEPGRALVAHYRRLQPSH